MNTKLTLSIGQGDIEKAKRYASDQGRRLSGIVEEYLKSLSTKNNHDKKKELSKIVSELKGSVKIPHLDKSYKELL